MVNLSNTRVSRSALNVITLCEFGFSLQIQGSSQFTDELRNLLTSLNHWEITNHGETRYRHEVAEVHNSDGHATSMAYWPQLTRKPSMT